MSRRTSILGALIVSVSLVIGGPAYAGHHGGGGPAEPGSSGVGDPYFPDAGNGGYDARHYDLSLAWDPTSKRLDGIATIEARATQHLSSFDLDFRSLDISRLTVDHRPATYTRSGQELVVTPSRALRRGEHFTVRVVYGGVPAAVIDPDGSPDGWIATDDGVFVANEPQGSPSWFPVNDHPTDKATYTVRMTVPKGLTAVGNGRLVEQRTRRGHTTFVWHEGRPMASYLATITIGRFQVTRYRTRHGLPIYLAVDPREAADAAGALAKLPRIIAFEESVFGRYPFESAGAIVDQAPDVGYALESQTKPVYDQAPDVSTVVHEMAHQWFGDSVSLTSWKDIWLNEGFAAYAEWLWSEHTGDETAQQIFDDQYATPADRTGFWNPPPANPGSGEQIFDGTVYNRGAMTLQALRAKIGNRAFFRVLRSWATNHRYGNATTKQFIHLAERVSHRDLDAFFTTWLYTEGKPTSW